MYEITVHHLQLQIDNLSQFRFCQRWWLYIFCYTYSVSHSSGMFDWNLWHEAFIFTLIGCARCSCHGFCLSPSLCLALFLWSYGPGLCLFPVLFPSPAPSPVPSPSLGPAAPFPALALFPAPSAPARTPAAPSPACLSLLLVSAEQNTDWFSWCHTRSSEALQSTSYCAQIKWFPDLKKGFIQERALH